VYTKYKPLTESLLTMYLRVLHCFVVRVVFKDFHRYSKTDSMFKWLNGRVRKGSIFVMCVHMYHTINISARQR